MGSHAPTGSPPSAPPLCRVSASHAAVITLRHRLQVLRAVAHVAPWWLYPLCMLALLIPACASAGVHGGRMLAARSPCPCPYPCPYPWPCPRPCPSSRTQGTPSWLLFSHGALLARQASAYSGRSAQPARGPEGSASRPWPHAPRHTPHATRDAGLRDAIYKFVARNRIRIFGAVETCRRATLQDKKHFL